MPVTFCADLPSTTLGDFAEHVNISLKEMVKWEIPNEVHFPDGALMMWIPPQAALAFGIAEPNVYTGLLIDVPNPGNTRAKVEIYEQGAIERKWVFQWRENHISSVPHGMSAYKVDADGNAMSSTSIKLPFSFVVAELRATVYHRDRLRVIVSVPEGGGWTQHFIAWLESRWGKNSYIPAGQDSDQRQSMNEQFVVFDNPANFVGWLNGYGEAHQPNFKPSGKPVGFLGPSKAKAIHHTVTVEGGEKAGYIGIDILPIDAEHLEVSAKTFSQMNIIGRLTPGIENPHRDELEDYFVKLIRAIKKRWPQPMEADSTQTHSKAQRKPQPNSQYRATLVKWKVDSHSMGLTQALASIGLKHDNYQNILEQNAFLDDEQMNLHLNRRTYEQAWQSEVDKHSVQ